MFRRKTITRRVATEIRNFVSDFCRLGTVIAVSDHNALLLLFVRLNDHHMFGRSLLSQHSCQFAEQKRSRCDGLRQSQGDQLDRSFALPILLWFSLIMYMAPTVVRSTSVPTMLGAIVSEPDSVKVVLLSIL